MADGGLSDSEQQETEKIEETRQRFRNEYVDESAEKYDPRDVERLETDDSYTKSFLTWRHFIVEDTLKMIDESFQWRKELGVNDLDESCVPKWTFETGAVYLHGYDKEENKLFWFKVKLHVKDVKTFLDKRKYVAFWLERYARREPGKLLTVVFDMSESGISNIPIPHLFYAHIFLLEVWKNIMLVALNCVQCVDMEFVKYIINCFKIYYPKFLSKMIMYEMPWIMNAAWKIVKTWLDPDAIDKLKFVTKNDVQTYIDAEYLPPHMGGTDPFKYSYPPLPDDDFQSPLCENGGPIIGEDEKESRDGDVDQLDLSFSSDQSLRARKVNFAEDGLKVEEAERTDTPGRSKVPRRPSTTFKGQLLHISPAEELCFGSKDNERKYLIILNNVTRNPVAFKVRTTAPEKYRVKPSNSWCEPGASVDIIVSLHGGYQASPQDRFLVMAAEMELSSGATSPELSQFWKEVPRSKIMEHRLRCHTFEKNNPVLGILSDSTPLGSGTNGQPDLHSTLMRAIASNSRLERKLDQCLWLQKVLMILVSFLTAVCFSTFYMLYTGERTP